MKFVLVSQSLSGGLQYIRGGGVSVLDGDPPFAGLFLPFLSFLSFAFFCRASRSFSFSSSACLMASASCSVWSINA